MISMYHLIIDWAKPNISFSQSPPHYIPSMNVGSHGINQNKTKPRLLDPKPPEPSTIVILPPWF